MDEAYVDNAGEALKRLAASSIDEAVDHPYFVAVMMDMIVASCADGVAEALGDLLEMTPADRRLDSNPVRRRHDSELAQRFDRIAEIASALANSHRVSE